MNELYSQDFLNPGFENSGSCSATNCSHENISCIDDWWNFVSPRDVDDIAWISYDCNQLSPCEGERGILIIGREEYDLHCIATTYNPMFGADPLDKYVVTLEAMPLLVNVDFWIVVKGSNITSNDDAEDEDVLGFAEVTGAIEDCQMISISLDQEHNVTDYEYILFEAYHTSPSGINPKELASVQGIIDNVDFCKGFDIIVSEAECENLCVQFEVNDGCAVYNCCGERSVEECQLQIVVQDGVTEFDTLHNEIVSTELCIPRNESGEYTIIVYAEDCDGLLFWDTIEYVIPECDDITVSTTTIWTSVNVPNNGRFQEVLIEDGVTLTVSADVTLSFCSEGELIIEPNAELKLYGTLTSACNDGWEGVRVYGDAGHSQEQDISTQDYYQGHLIGYPGAVIENAWTGVELFGPDPDDTGGRIHCDSTFFLNNQVGVRFGPFENIATNGQPRPYRASFKECTFKVDNNYVLAGGFAMHARLNGVYNVLFHGCDFTNELTLADPYAYVEYGYGIYAINSRFTVSAVTSEGPPYVRSSFTGLGVGVRVLPFMVNKFYEISQSDFTDCFNGIVVDGVSAGTIYFNTFNMGDLPAADIINWEIIEHGKALSGGQIGVVMSNGISGFVLEENEFVATAGNADHTIGIVADNLSSADNLIRRNTFDGLTISNEAFGINGFSHLPTPIGGLKYFCNENTDTDDKDFYVTDDETSGYAINNIHTYQGQLIPDDADYAAGNVFASTGDQTDGDFANYGSSEIDYWYKIGDSNQEPDAEAGLNNIVPSTANDCEVLYCIPSCPTDLHDDKEEYLTTVPLYYDALNNEEWDTATAYKLIMDRAVMRVIQFYLQDTVTFSNDSLMLWYHYLLTPVGEILRSKYYASKGDFTTAGQLLAAIPNFYDLSQHEEDDLDFIQDIYDILDARSIDNLTQGDLDDLEVISVYPGHSGGLAKGILSHYDYHFGPEYYLPHGEEEQIQLPGVEHTAISNDEVMVYPNPSNGDGVIVYVASTTSDQPLFFVINDLMGKIIYCSNISNGKNEINLRGKVYDGVYAYMIVHGDKRLDAGVFVVMESLKN